MLIYVKPSTSIDDIYEDNLKCLVDRYLENAQWVLVSMEPKDGYRPVYAIYNEENDTYYEE